MAKSNTIQVKMVSTADTGYFYVKFKNPKTKTEKLELKKYDPKVRKHVIFKEQKITDYKIEYEKKVIISMLFADCDLCFFATRSTIQPKYVQQIGQ